MKRALGILIALAVVGTAFCQSNFTIRKPVDGATVREIVPIRIAIPNDVPRANVYVGIMINGKFVEAVDPGASGDLIYRLDTKGRKIADGKLNFEAVLYADLGDTSRVLNRSSVELNVDNHTSIKIPAGGMKIRYKFQPGHEFTYVAEQRQVIATITDAQRRSGSRAAELPSESEKIRYLYAHENKYNVNGGTEGLIRLQPLVTKGKDYVFLRTSLNPDGRRYLDFELAPIYMRITDTGREVFGSAPFYIPMEGSVASGSRLDLFALNPLPVLPTRAVKPGDRWAAPFLLPKFDMENLLIQNKFTSNNEARAVLESIEYQGGRPTAKIHISIQAGAAVGTSAELGKALGPVAQELDQVVWFDLNLGMPVRIEQTMTIDIRADAIGQGAGGNGGANSNGGGRGGGIAPEEGDGFSGPTNVNQAVGGGGIQGEGGGPTGGGRGGGRGGQQPPGGRGGGIGQGGGRSGSQGGAGQILYIRQRIQETMVLER